MTYTEIKEKAKEGAICKLPKYEGYFQWNYSCNDMIFCNKNYVCLADDLSEIKDRDDFYPII